MSTSLRLLRQYQHRPRRRLSQSFLTDDAAFRSIVAACHLDQEDTVVEIGAGLGVMTAMLAEKAGKVFALEVDPALISVLQQNLDRQDRVIIVNMDVLKYDFAEVAREATGGKIRVIGNIPYHITSEILFRLLTFARIIQSAVLLMQKEVAERITALPGTKAYGIPTVILGMYADVEKLFDVPSRSFYPVPAVDSSVVRIVFRDKPRFDLNDETFFQTVVRTAFARRRKTLLNNLKALSQIQEKADHLGSFLDGLGIDGNRRAESLTLAEFAILSNALHSAKNPDKNTPE